MDLNVGPTGTSAQSSDGIVVEVVVDGTGVAVDEVVDVDDVDVELELNVDELELEVDVVGTLVEVDVTLVEVVGTAVVVTMEVVVATVVVVGATNPCTTITRFPPPNVEKRKSPVSGSMTAPSAPDRFVMNTRRVAGSGSPFASIS
jgi:hypothetical protein